MTVAGNRETTFTTTTAQAVASTDAWPYRWVSVHITSQGTASTITFQGSNDNSNWVNIPLVDVSSVGATAPVTSTTSVSLLYHGPLPYRFFRLSVTGISAGTTAGVVEFLTAPSPLLAMAVTLGSALAGENLPLDVLGVAQKPVVASTYSGTAFGSFGTVTNASVTAVPAMLKSIYGSNLSAALVYLQVFNLAAAPTEDSSVPLFSWAIPAGTATQPGIREIGTEFLGESGHYFSAGLAWGVSASPEVFNAGALTAANHVVNGVRV